MKKLMRHTLQLIVAFLLISFNGIGQASEKQTLPNIVLIVADDLGYGDLGCYGADDIATPQLDSLAAQGVHFTTFYANGPECTPTRAALLTGRYQQRVGGLECAIGLGNVGRYDDAIRLANNHNLGLPPSYSVLPSMLKDIGYNAAIVGKWHLGYEPKFSPLAHGFDFSIGPLGGGIDYFHHSEPVGEFIGYEMAGNHDFYRNGREHHREGYYMTHLVTDESVAWINQQNNGRPFFLYVPYTAPHNPYQGPEDYKPEKLPQDEWGKGTQETYSEMVEELDKGIGEILAKLEEQGLSDNTVVFFFSDNGPTRKGSAGPFSGYKGSVFEGGIRVPCIIRWPGQIKAGTVSDQMAISMDLTASIARIAGVSPPKDRPFDGIDIMGHVEQEKQDYSRTLFWRRRRGENDRKAVRDGAMKYLYEKRDDGSVTEHLFNLKKDPAEQNNLLKKRPEELKRLKKLLAEWEVEVQPER